MSLFYKYDPGLVLLSWKGITFMGFADGTFIQAERSEDAFSMAVGAHGDVTRVRNRNKSGTVTVTLQAGSPTNDLLSSKMDLDELFGTEDGPLFLKDLNGTTLISATSAWLVKLPSVEFGTDASNREWVIACAELNMGVGGSTLQGI